MGARDLGALLEAEVDGQVERGLPRFEVWLGLDLLQGLVGVEVALPLGESEVLADSALQHVAEAAHDVVLVAEQEVADLPWKSARRRKYNLAEVLRPS